MDTEQQNTLKDIVEVAGAAHYLSLHQQGRTTSDKLFSSVPPSDPAYISGNVGGMVAVGWAMHWFAVLIFIPWLVVSAVFAMLVGGGLVALARLASPGHETIPIILESLTALWWIYVAFWRIGIKRIVLGAVKAVFD